MFDAGKDVDGDGVPDVIAGAPLASPSVLFQGEVRVYSGSTGSLLHVVAGPAANTSLGAAVVLTGDLNGDLLSDFAAGTTAGTVWVYSGFDATPILTTTPPVSWGTSDWRPLAVADISGEGIADLVVGAPFASPPGAPGAGGVVVLSGSGGGLLLAIPGTQPLGRLGWSIASAGDLDGDTLPELIVGAPAFLSLANTFQNGLSFAKVFSGASGAALYTFFPAFGCTTCQNARFGWSVTGGGDLDGDQLPDLVVGQTLFVGLAAGPGNTSYSGATGTPLYQNTDYTGTSVRHLGDVDGDGFGDFLGGCVDGPLACAFLGGIGSCGRGVVFSGSDGTVIYELRRQGSAALGSSAAAPGDVNGDDFPDVVLGDPYWQPVPNPATWSGRITMFSLAPIGVQVFGQGCMGTGTSIPRIGVRGSPTVGAPLGIHLSGAPAGVPAVLLLGVSELSWGPFFLPLDLSLVGMPGCSLLTSVEFFVPSLTQAVAPAPGRASVLFTVPPTPTLSGLSVFSQWFVAGTPNAPFPGAMTRGVRLTIQ